MPPSPFAGAPRTQQDPPTASDIFRRGSHDDRYRMLLALRFGAPSPARGELHLVMGP